MGKLTAIDLFAGCGGLTVGLKKAGFKVVGAVEFDDLAAESYTSNHRSTAMWNQDIRDINLRSFKRALGLRKGQLDLLAGCPPCQGFSTLRTLNGRRDINDPRNDLIYEFQRFVEELKPKAVMMENVPGLVKDQRMVRFVNRLEALGYSVEYKILDVSRYGVPQRRRRAILLAGLKGRIEWAPEVTKKVTVRDAIFELPEPGKSGDDLHDLPEARSNQVKKIISLIPIDGGSRSALSDEHQLVCHKKIDGFSDVYGRMAWDDVAPTITTGCINPSKGRFLHPEQNRAITLREAALLQSFPGKYKLSMRRGKYAAAVLIGNALPTEFCYKHALSIKKYLRSP